MAQTQRENFGSSLGALLAMAGSAVGLGNIWRFPYMLGQYGGGVFIIVYLICVLVLSVPIMSSEFIIGRRSQKDAFTAFRALTPRRGWRNMGFLYVLIPTITVSYYCVIGGWTIKYFFDACADKFSSGASPDQLESVFGSFVSSTWTPLAFHLVFLLATAVIVAMGVKKGIEKTSKVMMPLLFFIMIIIAVRSLTLDGASQGISYLFKPDFSKISADMILAAMGQAFFSLSIGMGIMVAYGSYLPKTESIFSTALSTAIADLVFAIIAGCAIMPAVFAFGLQPAQGAGLVYKTLPVVFSMMPLGSFVAAFFFFAVILAALTSSMSLFEVPVGYLIESKHVSRPVACAIVFVVALVLGVLCSLSYGPLSGLQLDGRVLFDMFDYFTANYLMPLAGLMSVLFVGWEMKKLDVADEFTNSGKILVNGQGKPGMTFKVVYFIVRYLAPVAIIAIFVSGVFA